MTLIDDAQARLATEEAQAWSEYLEATQSVDGDYTEVEPWAWARLRQRLQSIDARRGRIAGDAAA